MVTAARIDETQTGALIHIVQNLRDDDVLEISATRPFGQQREVLARQIVYLCTQMGEDLHSHGWVLYSDDGEPVSAMGFWTMWPGVASVWAFGTDRWGEVILSMTKLALRTILPMFYDLGIHRAECRSLAGREDSEKWLALLGMEHEAVLAGFGRQREDFILYVWLDQYEPETAH